MLKTMLMILKMIKFSLSAAWRIKESLPHVLLYLIVQYRMLVYCVIIPT